MYKRYYNTIFSLYRKGTVTIRGSQKQASTIIYENKKCAIWGKEKKYSQTAQAVQTDINGYNVNVSSEYYNILIGDIFVINGKQYKVSNNPVPHERSNGIIDNYEISVSLTTDNSDIT